MKYRRIQRFASVAALVLAIQLLLAPPSFADFHEYSKAWEISASPNYDGLQGSMVSYNYSATTTCAYEPLWLTFNSADSHWIEVGISHGCGIGSAPNHIYVYLSKPDGSFAGFVDTEFISADNSTSRNMAIVRNTTGFKVYADNAWLDLDIPVSSAPGYRLMTGLESYDSAAVIANHTHWNLQRKVNNVWAFWTGYDGSAVDTPNMCGGWNSEHVWRMAENSSC